MFQVRSLVLHKLTNTSIYISLFVIYGVLFVIGARTAYLLQLYGFSKFFCVVPNVMCFLAFILGLIGMLISIVHYHIDIVDNNVFNNELSSDFIDLYKPIERERICKLFLALFTAFAVIRLLFVWFITFDFILLTQTVYYTISTILLLFIMFFCFINIFHYIVVTLQTPPFIYSPFLLPNYLNLRQVINSMLFPKMLIFPFLMCAVSFVTFYLVRLFIMFFFAITQYNLTGNLFYWIEMRSLAAIIFDDKYSNKEKGIQNDMFRTVSFDSINLHRVGDERMRAGSDDTRHTLQKRRLVKSYHPMQHQSLYYQSKYKKMLAVTLNNIKNCMKN